jgi:hypothetical protein
MDSGWRNFKHSPTSSIKLQVLHLDLRPPGMKYRYYAMKNVAIQTGKAVVDFTLSSMKLVLQSCTLGCLSSVSITKRE